MSWFNFYKNRVNSSYLEYAEKRYDRMIQEIFEFVMYDSTIVEAGCGIGTITKIVRKHRDVDIICFDNDKDMLSLAKANLAEHKNISIVQHDILQPFGFKDADLVFSHGVLEHFTDDEIRQIISSQRQYAKYIMHYVPGNKYKVPSFGDERLLSKWQWIDISSPYKVIEFNEGFDYLLLFER
jgi:trans-aconitate methyltransferase